MADPASVDMNALRASMQEQQRAMRMQQEHQLQEQQRQREEMARMRQQAMQQQMAQRQERAAAGIAAVQGGVRGFATRALTGGINPLVGGQEYISPLAGLERGYIAPSIGGFLAGKSINFAGGLPGHDIGYGDAINRLLFPNIHYSMAYGERGLEFAKARAGGMTRGFVEAAYSNPFIGSISELIRQMLPRTIGEAFDVGEISEDQRKQFIERKLEFMGADFLNATGLSTDERGRKNRLGRLMPTSRSIGALISNDDVNYQNWRDANGLEDSTDIRRRFDVLSGISRQAAFEDRTALNRIRSPKEFKEYDKDIYGELAPKMTTLAKDLTMSEESLDKFVQQMRSIGMATRDAVEFLSNAGSQLRQMKVVGTPEAFLSEATERMAAATSKGLAPLAAGNAALNEIEATQLMILNHPTDRGYRERLKVYGVTATDQAAGLSRKTAGLRQSKLAEMLVFADEDGKMKGGSLQERLARASQRLAKDPLSLLREQASPDFLKRIETEGTTDVVNAFSASGLPKELVWSAISQTGGVSMLDSRNVTETFQSGSSMLLEAAKMQLEAAKVNSAAVEAERTRLNTGTARRLTAMDSAEEKFYDPFTTGAVQ